MGGYSLGSVTLTRDQHHIIKRCLKMTYSAQGLERDSQLDSLMSQLYHPFSMLFFYSSLLLLSTVKAGVRLIDLPCITDLFTKHILYCLDS